MSKAFKIGVHGIPNIADEDEPPSVDNPTVCKRDPPVDAPRLYSFAEDDDRLDPTQLLQSLRRSSGTSQVSAQAPAKDRTIMLAERRPPVVEHTALMPTAPSMLASALAESIARGGGPSGAGLGGAAALDATMLAPSKPTTHARTVGIAPADGVRPLPMPIVPAVAPAPAFAPAVVSPVLNTRPSDTAGGGNPAMRTALLAILAGIALLSLIGGVSLLIFL